MRNLRLGALAGWLIAVICFGTQAGEVPSIKSGQPSANKGKPGQYQCHTSHPGYDYWVGVPKNYSESNPAGLLVFFHGQGCPGTAQSLLETWYPNILDPYNVIAVDMQYQDGDNTKDTPGKVAACREAIAQTMADYKIVAGRGIICSFSGGGCPHGLFFSQSAKVRGTDWPFCHMGQYSSNFRVSVPGNSPPMTWFFSVGQKEWDLATLGKDAVGHMLELLGAINKGGVPDLRLKVMKGKDHHIEDAEVKECVKGFRRSDLAFAPFLYEPDYADKDFAQIARQANALNLSSAVSALDRLIAGKGTPEDVRKKAEAVKQKISSRVAAILALTKELAEDDAILCSYYGQKFSQQLAGLPEAKDLQQILGKAPAMKDLQRVQSLHAALKDQLKGMFTGGAGISAPAVPFLEQVKTTAGEKSQFGGMAAEFLLLK